MRSLTLISDRDVAPEPRLKATDYQGILETLIDEESEFQDAVKDYVASGQTERSAQRFLDRINYLLIRTQGRARVEMEELARGDE
jgi:hypothetical protein